ncbi:ABC transporter ATP-binding protein [Paenibacillus whitsoniae]|nr:ABC transporter ATP-binding protein [Paenibacillus whitsoniae]
MLEVHNLKIRFHHTDRSMQRSHTETIHSLSLSINAGEIVAVVGASGSGKSLLAHAILGILPANAEVSGEIHFQGQALTSERQKRIRGKDIALIPQSVAFLDPLMHVGTQVRQAARQGDPTDLQEKAFQKYKLASAVAKWFPFQLSGGMARKVLVSTATVSGAKLFIADEPTPGLDASAMTETLERFRELADGGGAVMLITHDIEAALTIADRISVLHAGTLVETAPRKDFDGDGEGLRHPYTQALLRALPSRQFTATPSTQLRGSRDRSGCAYATSCILATETCREEVPPWRQIRDGEARCFHAT